MSNGIRNYEKKKKLIFPSQPKGKSEFFSGFKKLSLFRKKLGAFYIFLQKFNRPIPLLFFFPPILREIFFSLENFKKKIG